MHLLANDLRHLVDVEALADSASNPSVSPPFKVEIDLAPGTAGSVGFLARTPYPAQPDTSLGQTTSKICLVGYFLADADGGTSLYRALIPSKTTFERIVSGKTFVAGDWNSTNAFTERVASNVVANAFEVQFLDSELQPVTAPEAAAYVRVALKVLSNRAAQLYFDTTTSATVRSELAEREAKEFTLRWKL